MRDGLEGLIHISELSHQRVAHPGDVVHEGQQLKLKIISLDSERHRLGLSLKQAEEPPARPAPEPTPISEPVVANPSVAPGTPRPERRPRPERSYSMSDAVQEPEGGIDNTLASAFAQVRQQLAAAEGSDGPDIIATETLAVEPPPADVEAQALEADSEPVAVAESVAVAEPAAVADGVVEPELAPASEPVMEAASAVDDESTVPHPVEPDTEAIASAASTIEEGTDSIAAPDVAAEDAPVEAPAKG